MNADVFLLVREAADGLTSIELADALRCSRRTAVHYLVELKLAGEIESTGDCRGGAAIFVIRMKPRQLALPSMSEPTGTLHRVQRMFPGLQISGGEEAA